jgi:D-arabinose 1-dehydrogenase-like Zn-dependent alcohol dehydrogenase
MFASALGATITTISHTSSKSADATSMGSTSFICTGEKDWWVGNERSFNILLCTSFVKDWPIKNILVC